MKDDKAPIFITFLLTSLFTICFQGYFYIMIGQYTWITAFLSLVLGFGAMLGLSALLRKMNE